MVHMWVCNRESKREREKEREREISTNNSLALVATEEHTSELLEALPDRVDVGKVLVHHLTVWIVVCNREREREREKVSYRMKKGERNMCSKLL